MKLSDYLIIGSILLVTAITTAVAWFMVFRFFSFISQRGLL